MECTDEKAMWGIQAGRSIQPSSLITIFILKSSNKDSSSLHPFICVLFPISHFLSFFLAFSVKGFMHNQTTLFSSPQKSSQKATNRDKFDRDCKSDGESAARWSILENRSSSARRIFACSNLCMFQKCKRSKINLIRNEFKCSLAAIAHSQWSNSSLHRITNVSWEKVDEREKRERKIWYDLSPLLFKNHLLLMSSIFPLNAKLLLNDAKLLLRLSS